MITTTEELLTLTQAAKTLPHPPHVSTLWRWCKYGVNGVRLDYLRLGGRILTSREALLRFGEAVTLADEQPSAKPRGWHAHTDKRRRTPEERAKAAEAARRRIAGAVA